MGSRRGMSPRNIYMRNFKQVPRAVPGIHGIPGHVTSCGESTVRSALQGCPGVGKTAFLGGMYSILGALSDGGLTTSWLYVVMEIRAGEVGGTFSWVGLQAPSRWSYSTFFIACGRHMEAPSGPERNPCGDSGLWRYGRHHPSQLGNFQFHPVELHRHP